MKSKKKILTKEPLTKIIVIIIVIVIIIIIIVIIIIIIIIIVLSTLIYTLTKVDIILQIKKIKFVKCVLIGYL